MKKILITALVVLMVLGAFGCGGNGGGAGESAGGGSTGGNAELKVGFILIGSKTDGGFSEAHANGIAAMEAHFAGRVEAVVMEDVDDQNNQDIRTAAENMIDIGCGVIIACSYGYIDVMAEMAEEYPEIYFLHFSGNLKNYTNFDNYFGAMEEPRYLAGIVAGMMTETNKIGYVAAYNYTEVNIGINAFALGVQSVNPDAVVNVVYINTWLDPEKEKSAAEALLAQGCDVLEQHCDTAGPIIAAEEKGAYAIGYNLDKPDVAPGAYLTAPVWDHGAYYISVIDRILEGVFVPESYYGRMSNGYVDLAPLTGLVPDNVKAKVDEVKNDMLAGGFSPFTGEIYYADADKGLLCMEGQTLTRGEIWSTSGVVRGVNAAEM